MISSLRGKIISIKNTEILMDVNGVGYQVFITKRLSSELPGIDSEFIIITHLDVKESSLILYGFADEKERELFKMLITVNGIGPKLAHTVLTNSTFEEVMGLITGTNRALKIPGLGTKKIDLIAMTLKDKIFKISSGMESENITYSIDTKDKNVSEAVGALISLGYSKNEAERIIGEVTKDEDTSSLSTEEIIRKSLQYSS
ncbi:MAG TPA: Holliday junction branch migration protein RuvA [Ignavibacteria bacterium]|nr:Holliday junction branch migration protein RuvA [Ignavibacteria bacterium]